jgi:RNA polymerase sigma factor (sigma-70 family)
MRSGMDDSWQNWLQSRSEDAFRAIVRRHLPLVLATAQRRTNGNAALAQDISQLVFIDLARHSKALPKGVVLAGWLYRHTCFTASKVLRSERRRSARERVAAEQASGEPGSIPEQAVDELLEKLPARDRHALLLRFAEGMDLQGVADALSISRVAAQKRIERALARLKETLPHPLRPRIATAAGLTALLVPAQTKSSAATMTQAVEQMALVAGKTGRAAPLLTFFRNLGAMQGAALGVAVSVIVWAVPVALQVREFQNRKSEAKAGSGVRKESATPGVRRVRITPEDAGKQMASVFLTHGFSSESAKLALPLLKLVSASDRLEAVQAMLGALPEGSARSSSVVEVLRNFARDGAWRPKKYPDDVLTALELMPNNIDPQFDEILANHPDVDATLRLHREIRHRNESRLRKRLQEYPGAVARALAGRDVKDALDFCRSESGGGLEGLMKAVEHPDQRRELWYALASETDRKFQTIALAKLTTAAPSQESSAVIDNLPAGKFRNDAATLLLRKQLDGPEAGSTREGVKVIVDAWLSRVPAEERAEQFDRLLNSPQGGYWRIEELFRSLAPVFTGQDLDRMLQRCVTVFADVSSPPTTAIEALEKIADPDIRYSAACEMLAKWVWSARDPGEREKAKEWMAQNFSPEQREAYNLLNKEL